MKIEKNRENKLQNFFLNFDTKVKQNEIKLKLK